MTELLISLLKAHWNQQILPVWKVWGGGHLSSSLCTVSSVNITYKSFIFIFQLPEMDETYAEDSFVVGSDVEEPDSDEEEDEGVELLPEASYVGGRRQYATRRRVFLHKAKAAAAGVESPPRTTTARSKRSRVIRVQDSSDEEEHEETGLTTGGCEVRLLANIPQEEPSVQKDASSASSTIASKVSLLRNAQKRSPSEEQLNQR